jgi:hypothetical protein
MKRHPIANIVVALTLSLAALAAATAPFQAAHAATAACPALTNYPLVPAPGARWTGFMTLNSFSPCGIAIRTTGRFQARSYGPAVGGLMSIIGWFNGPAAVELPVHPGQEYVNVTTQGAIGPATSLGSLTASPDGTTLVLSFRVPSTGVADQTTSITLIGKLQNQ